LHGHREFIGFRGRSAPAAGESNCSPDVHLKASVTAVSGTA
jgi:hypothetical protein